MKSRRTVRMKMKSFERSHGLVPCLYVPRSEDPTPELSLEGEQGWLVDPLEPNHL